VNGIISQLACSSVLSYIRTREMLEIVDICNCYVTTNLLRKLYTIECRVCALQRRFGKLVERCENNNLKSSKNSEIITCIVTACPRYSAGCFRPRKIVFFACPNGRLGIMLLPTVE
jgi:hypothetical protein